MKKIHLILFGLLVFSACNQSENKAKESSIAYNAVNLEEAPAMEMSAPPPVSEINMAAGLTSNGAMNFNVSGATTFAEKDGKNYESAKESIKIPTKIRKTANLNITVDDYKKARATIEKIVQSAKGYIGSEDEQNNTYSIYNTMVIRVMNKDFDAMVNNVTGIASHVNSKNITAEDVTAQFVDIQTRLKSKREIEKRYLDILQKASKVTDILEIEQKLGEIREEVEAKEGELKYLSDQVDYSTINLTLQQNFEYSPVENPGFFGRLGTAFGNGWNGFLSFIVGLVYGWPLVLVIVVGSYFIVKLIKKRLKK